MKLSKILQLCNEYGFKTTFPVVLASSSKSASNLQHRAVLKYLRRKYAYVIEKYKSQKPEHKISQNMPLWSMWWQGEDNAPEIVKLCFARMREYSGDHELRIITRENFRDYVSLPDYVFEKVRAKKMTLNAMANILREYLLVKHGGLWMDSTIYVANQIPEDIFTREFYTIRRELNTQDKNIAHGRWSTFLQAAQAGNILCEFLLEFLLEYWRNQENLLVYFLFDYAFEIAYNDLPLCREILDSVPLNNPNVYELEKLMQSGHDSEFSNLLSDPENVFFKLSWKSSYSNLSNVSGKAFRFVQTPRT